MNIERFEISKGPDKWLLAQSLFNEQEFPGDGTRVRFTTRWNGEEVYLHVTVESITRLWVEDGGYRIKGVCRILKPRPHQVLVEHIPIEVNFSVHSRKGFAQVSF